MRGLLDLRKEGLRAWTLPPMPASPCPGPSFTPVFLSGSWSPRPHPLFPLLQRRLFEKKQRRKRQEPLMVQANPDASLRPRPPWRQKERLAGDRGEGKFPVSGRSLGLEGRGLREFGTGPKGLRVEGRNGVQKSPAQAPWGPRSRPRVSSAAG